jgi:hypothetical protein
LSFSLCSHFRENVTFVLMFMFVTGGSLFEAF